MKKVKNSQRGKLQVKWINSRATKCMMKILMIGILVCVLTPGIFANQKSSVTAWRLSEEIILDGRLDEWNMTSPIILNNEEQLFRDANQWFGESDLSAHVYVMWDEINLYIAAEINDDTPFMYREGFPPDLADSLVLYFGLDPTADPHRTTYLSTDFRILLVLDDYLFNTSIDRTMVCNTLGIETIGDYGDEQAFEGYEAAIHAADRQSYVFEARIPWKNFANDQISVFIPEDGVEIGFNVEMNDLDFPCPGVATPGICWTGSGECKEDPSQWGVLTFRDGGLQ